MHFEHPNIGSLPHSYFICRVIVDFLQYSFEQFGHLNFTPTTKTKLVKNYINLHLNKTNFLTTKIRDVLYNNYSKKLCVKEVKVKIKKKKTNIKLHNIYIYQFKFFSC